jgi:transposase-like protein
MIDPDQPKLRNVVEADETYIGGKFRAPQGMSRSEIAKRRRDNKTVVLGAIERGGELRLRVAPNSEDGPIKEFLGDVVHDEAEAIYTDSHRSYRGIQDHNTRHEYVDHSREEWVRGDVHTNTIESAWSLFDRAVIGSYHKISRKHLPAYLSEFEFRFNNRENPFLFRDTILALVEADALTFDQLTNP